MFSKDLPREGVNKRGITIYMRGAGSLRAVSKAGF